MAKRYIAETQGDAGVMWNVLDTWNCTYKYHAISDGKWAKQIARQLNKENKIDFFLFMADFGEFLLSFPHPKDFVRRPLNRWGYPR